MKKFFLIILFAAALALFPMVSSAMSSTYTYWSGNQSVSLVFYFSAASVPSQTGACDIYINGRYSDTYAVTLKNDIVKMPGIGNFYWDEGKDKLIYLPESVQILTLTGGN